MDRKKLSRFFNSKPVKRVTLVLGIAFFLLSLVSIIDIKPFLRFGYFGVFIFNLFGVGTLLIPSLAGHMNIVLLSIVSSLGTTLNDSVAWLVGRNGDVIIPRSRKIIRIEDTLHRYGPIGLFFWALIPFPFDLIGLIAGYLEFPYWRYVVPAFLGKFVRFVIIGYGVVKIFG